jgi:hypothetical protein
MADEASGKKEMCLKKIKIGLIKKINETLQGIAPYLKNRNIATGHSLKQVKPWEQ